MKQKFVLTAAAMALLAGCTGVSEITRISGTVDTVAVDEVNVVIREASIDTLVPVKDGKFYIEVPTDVTIAGVIAAADFSTMFIPDGTKLTVVLGPESKVSSNSSKSVQSRFTAYTDGSMKIQEDFRAEVERLTSDTALTETRREELIDSNYNSTISAFVDFNLKTIGDNSDNIISVAALQNVSGMVEAYQTDSIINTLSEKVRATEFVVSMKKSLEAKMNTAEGKKFTDFTIEDSDGKTVSFSDYVGKGKYVLVDFWASWCGPCKAEIPNIKAVYDKYSGKGLTVLSVAVWDDPADTKASAKEHGVVWPQIINAQSIPTQIYGIEGIPHIILVGPDGTILKRNLRGAEIEKAVSEYLK